MANHVKISPVVIRIILLLQMVTATPQILYVRKCKEMDHTIYLHRSSFLNCPEEETVNFSGLNLSTIRTNFVRSETIENILLDRNSIQVIPKNAFKYVSRLKCVDLSRNRIPYEWLMFEHANLKTLILNYQENYFHGSDISPMSDIWDLSKISWNFPNLEILSISGNKITSVDIPFESFPRLSVLYLSDNNIESLDPRILQNHTQLRNVHLEGNNIETIYLQDTLNLEELYLDRNPIKEITFDSYSNLKVLSLSDCSLEEPIYIFNPVLITFDMSRNRIGNITDETFQNTPSLENLNLMYNKITLFPYLAYLKHLKRLFLSYNNISILRYKFMPVTLKTLSLKGNRIEEFDEITFDHLDELEELDLSFNQLASLPVGWGDHLKMLRHLNLMSNRFTTLGDTAIHGLANLKELCMANNFMGSIDLHSLKIVPNECTVYVLN